MLENDGTRAFWTGEPKEESAKRGEVECTPGVQKSGLSMKRFVASVTLASFSLPNAPRLDYRLRTVSPFEFLFESKELVISRYI